MGRRHGMWPAVGCVVGLTVLLALIAIVTIVGQVLSVVFGFAGFQSRPFAGIAFVILVLAVVGLIRGFRRLAKPIGALVDAARRVESGDYAARVPEVNRGPRELRELTRAFNTMASRLAADQHQRRSLLADISHELRTPLAILRGNLEAIADGIHEPTEQHVAGLIEETRVLERLVEDLRTISLAEAGELPLHREPTDPDVLLGETVESFRAAAERKGVRLILEAPDNLPLLDVDPVRIREVIANLLGNALRHTREGGAVTVTGAPGDNLGNATDNASGDQPGCVISVADTGTGIDPALLPNVFDRFARGGESPGSGLGLAIARDLVEAHGGTIDVSSDVGRGTTFVVRLPSVGPPP
ncbi:MAG: HAMP domain-containing sensor histidine kinase [Chloroflexota bacterium]